MMLVLPFPQSWPVLPAAAVPTVVAIAAGEPTEASGELTLSIFPLVPLPEDPSQWGAPYLYGGLPAGARVAIKSAQDQETDLGWPLSLIESHVVDAAGNLLGLRLHAFYRCLEYGAVAVVYSSAAAQPRLETLRSSLLDLLGRGRPDFTTPGVILEQSALWSDVEVQSAAPTPVARPD
jgi:hypothetical protein